jgi:aspartyl-tRNA(Asn)/glutamyl-tRNA(Gln) amidotransferase subunit C
MDVREAQKIAGLARLRLTEGELARFATQLTAILGYFETLRAVDTAGVPPASHPPELRGPLRADATAPFADPAALVRASQGAEADFFRVPRILE